VIEPPLPDPLRSEKPTRRLSLTLSPLHLLNPIVELQVEVMVTPHLGVAAIGGFGSIEANSNDPALDDERFSAYELGLQLVGYPLQDFSSLQLGGELLWIHVSTENFDGREIRASAGGVAIGPFIGYKLLTDVGFTLAVQGGFQYVALRAEASNDAGDSAEDEQKTLIGLLNVNLGWSF
jgi:hypothetical protein